MISNRQDRDASMAENVRWLVDQMPATGKIVLWAHNGHVNTVAPAMGQALRQVYGSQMVVVGSCFGSGSFTAVTLSGNTPQGLATQTVGVPVQDSYEDYFLNSGIPRFILDLRNRDLSQPNTSWLAGPRLFRSIGSGFNPASPSSYFYQESLPTEFDLMIFFDRTNATQVLPFNYPSQF